MRVAKFGLVFLVSWLFAGGLRADWFPDEARALAARQVEGRLTEAGIDYTKLGAKDLSSGARTIIDRLATRIEAVGVEGLREAAPSFSAFSFPPLDDELFRLMATYSVCTLPLHLELAANPSEKFYVVVGEAAVIVVSVLLRDTYLKAGGTDAEIREALDSEAMNSLSVDIQTDEKLRNHTSMRCAPALGNLLQ